MKRFLGKLTIYLAIVLGISLWINAVYMSKVPPLVTPETDYNNQLKFENVPENIEICAFGSSHALFGYNFEAYEDKYVCFNFGLLSQSLSYDYRLLKHYKDNIAEGADVFVTVSDFVFFGKPEVEQADFESKNYRYYAFLKPWEIKNYHLSGEMLVGKLQAFGAGPKKLYEVLTDCYEETSEGRQMSFDDRWELPPDTDWLFKEGAEMVADQHLGEDRRDKNGNLIRNKEEIRALYDILALCKEIGANPVMIVIPNTAIYNEKVLEKYPDFSDEFASILSEVSTATGVPYYDYSADNRFQNYYPYFLNADHFNRWGAADFTDLLMTEVLGK